MEHPVHVDFRRPMPLFPLPHWVLLPHVVQPLLIFEPRYRQMLRDLLRESDRREPLLAMATLFPTRRNPGELRPIVCVAQIVEHQPLSDGRARIAVRGICRALLATLHEPDESRLYHAATLSPTEADDAPEELPGERERLRQLLAGPRLRRLAMAPQVLQLIDRDDVPTTALIELVGYALLNDSERRYRLLAEPEPSARARFLRHELRSLDMLVAKADRQGWRTWPKAMSWN